jgi:hypothetical protein
MTRRRVTSASTHRMNKYLVTIDVQADVVEIDFDVEHRPLKVVLARLHRENQSRLNIQRPKN